MTRLHLLTYNEQRRDRQRRRTNRRLVFAVLVALVLGFCVGTLTGCGSSVEPTAEEQVRVPPTCLVDGVKTECPKGS